MTVRGRAWILGLVGAVVLGLPARGLDTPVQQVMIEARLVELSRTESADLGVAPFRKNDRLDSSAQSFVAGELSAALAANADSRAQIEGMTDFASSPSGQAALGFIGASGLNIELALEAVERNGKVRLISRPTVTALNNQVASILAIQERPDMIGTRGRKLKKGAQAYREAFRCVAQDLALLGVAADLGAYIVPFFNGGFERQGLEVNGDLKLSSAKDRSTKKRYLRMRGRGREPVSGFVVTPEFAPVEGDTVIAMADLGFMKKPSPKRLANFQDAFIALELDIGSEYFVVAFQAAPDGQVQVFVATTGGVQDVIPLPGVEVNQVVTAVAIADGSTVTLGGLYRESGTEQRKVVPFLSDIPYIGGLFKAGVGGTNLRKETDVGARNLLVFVTPQIVMPTEQ